MEEQIHPAQKLIQGDKVIATIRHATDGSKNLNKVQVIFLECNSLKRTCDVVYLCKVYEVPFNNMF